MIGEKFCVLIIAMNFLVAGFVIGWKFGEAFGKKREE